MDAFSTLECKLLPECTMDVVAMTLNAVEQQEDIGWPAALLHAAMPLLKKGLGRKPLDQRLLTLMSCFYSAWAGIRYRGGPCRKWRSSWMPEQLRGARPGGRTQDVSFALCQLVELARAGGLELHSVLLDRVKCFDRLERKLQLKLMEKAGCPSGIVAARRKWYDHHERRMRLGQAYGPPFQAKNRCLQGGVWSIDDIGLIMACWVYDLERAVPNAEPGVSG